MKKLVMSIGAGMLLASGLAVANDTTFSGEIMDGACAKGGGHESMFKKMGRSIRPALHRAARSSRNRSHCFLCRSFRTHTARGYRR
jgi:hypothetical protein